MRGVASGVLMVALCVSFGSGCKNESASDGSKKAGPGTTPEAITPEVKEALGGAPTATASTAGRSDPLCVGPIDLAPSEIRKVGLFEATLEGYKVKFTGGSDDKFVVGVIGDVKEDTGENLFNLARFIEHFKAQGVQAVVMTGDTAETEAGLARVFETLAAPGWPIFVIAGNREATTIFADGVATAQEKYPNIFNLNKRRLIRFPLASFLSLPGYHDARFIHADHGCLYHSGDVAALKKVAAGVEGVKVLVSHGPPRGATKNAIDVATEAGNVGDPNINALIEEGKIAFGFFGNIHEAGGQATDLLGKAKVAESAFVKSFYLNVGPADAIRWMMNDGSESTGMAAVVTFKPDQTAAFAMKRLPALTETERSKAKKLDPPPAPASADTTVVPEEDGAPEIPPAEGATP